VPEESQFRHGATVNIPARLLTTESIPGRYEVAPEPEPEPEPLPDPVPDHTAEFEPDSVIETTVQGKHLVRSGRYYTFKAVYRSDDAFDPASLGGMTVAGPNGYAEDADARRIKSSRGGRLVSVTFRVMAPGGSFDASDNGTYPIVRTRAQAMPRSAALLPDGASDAAPGVSSGEASTTPVGSFEVNARSRAKAPAMVAPIDSRRADEPMRLPGNASELLG